MTLAEKIRQYDAKDNRSVDVAREIGCRDEYVRVVWQRMDPSRRKADRAKSIKWCQENRDRYNKRAREWSAKRYKSDPDFRAAHLERCRLYYQENIEAKRAYYRERYRKRNSSAAALAPGAR